MAIADAVKDNGGIAAVWELSFDGMPAIGLQNDIDIYFCYSNIHRR